MGLDFVRGSGAHAPYLKYGLENKLYSQKEVNAAQNRYSASRKY